MAETWPSLVAYLESSGVPHRVTSTTGDQHAPGSYHYAGQAIDAAYLWPTIDSPELHAIQWAWMPVADQLAELIGPDQSACIKNGQPHRYDPATMNAHQNHVHTAATINISWPTPEEPPMVMTAIRTHPSWDGGYIEIQDDGGVFAYGAAPFLGSVTGLGIDLAGLARIIDAEVTATGDGYWLMGADGAVYAFGDAQYHGGANE